MAKRTKRGELIKGPLTNKVSGFTLTEVAIVIGVVGALLGAIWIAGARVYVSYRTGKASNELVQIAQAVRAFYTIPLSTGNGSEELTTTLFIASILPKDIFDPSATADNLATIIAHAPWGGSTIKIYSDTYALAGDSFQVLFVNVPPAACIGLATQNTGSSRDTNLTGVGFTQTSSGNRLGSAGMDTTLPITAALAALECGTGNADIGIRI